MSNLYEYIKMAVHNIMANKGRSFLTMLGIIIGIASVIAIVSVGEGTKNQMNSEIDDIGGGQIAISVSDEAQERYSVLKLGDISPLRDENTHVIMRTYEEKEPDKKKKPQKSVRKRSTDALTAAGYDLFEALRKLRLEIAKEEAMPPYIVFSDKTLIDMCIKCPSNEEEMLEVSGVGENKLKKYGQRFLEEIQKFCLERPNAVLSMSEDENGNP